MNLTRLLMILVLINLVSCSDPTRFAKAGAKSSGGTEFGSGSDWISDSDRSHWFPRQGVSPVDYCIEVDPTFGKSKQELLPLVAHSFAQWESYLIRKKLPQSLLSFRAHYVETCTDSTPIRFTFGIPDDERSRSIAAKKNPFAMAIFDTASHRGRVTFANPGEYGQGLPNWDEPGLLVAELLHEVGHIYGNEHIPNTVMREDLANAFSGIPKPYREKIDHSAELVPCTHCSWSCEVKGPLSTALGDFDPNQQTLLQISHILADSPLQWLPFGPMSFSFPQYSSSTVMHLENSRHEQTWESIGKEALIIHDSGHEAFRVSDRISWSVPTMARAYVMNFASPSEGPISLVLKPVSDDSLEIRLPEFDTLVTTCPLR